MAISTPDPLLPTPVPVDVVTEVSVWEIIGSVGLPLLSLAIALVAVIDGILERKRRAAADAKREAADRLNERLRYGDKLNEYVRRHRDGQFTSVAHITDSWLELQHTAPDDTARTLVMWISREFGDLEHAFRDSRVDPGTARHDLAADSLNKINSWARADVFSDEPHFGRTNWP